MTAAARQAEAKRRQSPLWRRSPDQWKVLDYAKAHSNGAQITLAIEGGSQAAVSYIAATDDTVVGMGGFGGGDPAPSLDQLSTWVREGKLRFVLEGAGRGSRGGIGGRGTEANGSVGSAPRRQP
ncbi:hypothetical protein EV192_112285 [Actinocrispum wychmicini]|uniref:Putative mannosyltransferase YkcA/B-like C-terminal domain-containing protein n=1 Tax=Actinocrispum wychmicini TaxID=1213861 RepID=A0A4R2J2M6_9PSEU|nr:hypothetical protein EV192_112285 [Actinocrispum wychmicini]